MAVDPEIMADVRRTRGRSRWGGQLNPRPLGAEHRTTATLNRHSLRKLDGHGCSRDVSVLGIASERRDAQQLQLESLYAEFQQLKIEKEQLEREDGLENCSTSAQTTLDHECVSTASRGAVIWGLPGADGTTVTSAQRPTNLTQHESEPKQGIAVTGEPTIERPVVDDFGEVLRQHSMTPAQLRPALVVPKNPRNTSKELPVRDNAGGHVVDCPASVSGQLVIPDGRDSVDHWLLTELAKAEESEAGLKLEPEAEPNVPTVDLQLGPLTRWLQSLGLHEHAPQMLSMLPNLAVGAFTDEADCQVYFEDLVQTKQGLSEVKSLCTACGMAVSEQSILFRAVRAFATSHHTPSAPRQDRTVRAKNAPPPKPGTAARESIERRSVAAETRGRSVLATGPRLARSNRAADLRTRKSISMKPDATAEIVTMDQSVISVRQGAPFSSLLLQEISELEGADSVTNTAVNNCVGTLVRKVEDHSDLASQVLERGQQLLRQQERRRTRAAERAAAQAGTRKRLVEQKLVDLQINI